MWRTDASKALWPAKQAIKARDVRGGRRPLLRQAGSRMWQLQVNVACATELDLVMRGSNESCSARMVP